MALESFHLEHLPPNYNVHVALFKSVANAAFLHQQLLSGNTEFEYALIDASAITSKIHLLAAAYRAINDNLEGRLRTRNVHSEIVFCLSPNNNIAESFRRFGISPTTSAVLVIKVTTPSSPEILTATTIQEHLSASIQGMQIDPSDENICKFTDWARVRKVYKLPAMNTSAAGKGKGAKVVQSEWEERRELEVQVLGTMALRGFLS